MARKKKHEEHLNHEAWAIPYGDLITLLLAFFVVMYAISSVNEGKYRVLSDSLVAAFRGTPRTMEPVQVGEKQRARAARTSRARSSRPPPKASRARWCSRCRSERACRPMRAPADRRRSRGERRKPPRR